MFILPRENARTKGIIIPQKAAVSEASKRAFSSRVFLFPFCTVTQNNGQLMEPGLAHQENLPPTNRVALLANPRPWPRLIQPLCRANMSAQETADAFGWSPYLGTLWPPAPLLHRFMPETLFHSVLVNSTTRSHG